VNIKKNAARLQFGVACLVPNMEHLNNILANQNVTSSHDKDPNILTMSSTNVAWFPLLPVITTKETAVVADVVKKDDKKVRRILLKNFQTFHIVSFTATITTIETDWRCEKTTNASFFIIINTLITSRLVPINKNIYTHSK
jgi:hypothetical protein